MLSEAQIIREEAHPLDSAGVFGSAAYAVSLVTQTVTHAPVTSVIITKTWSLSLTRESGVVFHTY
jgi:hypothetical protein